MKAWAIQVFVTALIAKLDEEAVKSFIDAGLDKIEDMVEKSETKVDDALLPVARQFRAIFDVPDNDAPKT
jgi:hypothetical protein